MATINLLPASSKNPRKFRKEKAKTAQKQTTLPSPIFILIAVSSLLVLLWLSLAIQVKLKGITLASLNEKLKNLQGDYKKTEALTQKKTELNETIESYQKALGKNIPWQEKLRFLSSCLPPQIWLNSVSVEGKAEKTLVIKGCATSYIEAEIIDSISRFTTRLREDNDFKEIKLGTLVTEKKDKLSITNFGLTCRIKEADDEP